MLGEHESNDRSGARRGESTRIDGSKLVPLTSGAGAGGERRACRFTARGSWNTAMRSPAAREMISEALEVSDLKRNGSPRWSQESSRKTNRPTGSFARDETFRAAGD